MDAFAARRRAMFSTADELLEPTVRKALIKYGNGEADWQDDLVDEVSALWETVFKEESPHADVDRHLPSFQKALRDSLDNTDQPTQEGFDAQQNRIVKWLSTYAINDATFQAAGARGVRFKRWTSMNDSHVRTSHRLADGQIRPIGESFDVDGYDLQYPGEPVGPPEIWINCRCLLQAAARPGESAMTPTTFAMEDDVAVEDDELPTDVPEDDEDEITEIPVHGVLAPEGVPTGDGRQFGEGALTHRNLPLPIAYQLLSGDGHNGSATVGRIDEIFRVENELRFRGMLVMTKAHTPSVIEGIIDGTVRGVSVDVDDVELEMSDMDEMPDDGKMPVTVFSHARVAGVTIVPIPAFQEAYIGLGSEFPDEMSEEALAACAACADEGPDDDDDNEDIALGYDAFRDFPADARKKAADAGHALPDGSFPIENEEDLRNAIQAIGRAKDPNAAKAHIKKRARELGHPELIPEGWSNIHDLSVLDGPALQAYNSFEDDLEQRAWLEEYHPDAILASTATLSAGTGSVTYVTTKSANGQVAYNGRIFAPGTHDGPGWITHPIPTSRIRHYWTRGKGAAKIRWGQPGDFNRCRKQLAKYITNPDWLAGACANMHHEALGVWPGRPLSAITASGEPAPIFNLVASAGYIFDPNLFARTQMEDPRVGVMVEGDHVYGYVAQWGVCHIGISGICTEPPQSQTDYWYYATGMVDTEEGPIHVGQITMDTGHAPLKASPKVAAAHYDNTGSAVADIAVGEDDFGIWFSGRLRPSCTDEQRHALRASGRLSGDWRYLGGNLELVAALVVNVPGFPIPHTLVASADGIQTALVAAGVLASLAPDPAVTASVTIGADAEMIAAIARTAVAEYRHAEKREARTTPLRETLRQKRIETLRTKIKE